MAAPAPTAAAAATAVTRAPIPAFNSTYPHQSPLMAPQQLQPQPPTTQQLQLQSPFLNPQNAGGNVPGFYYPR